MGKTVAYVRVSTDDQTEHSPAGQAKRCRDLARLRSLGAVTVLADEGWSGKNLDRPKMQELLDLVRAGGVANVVVWSLDRLSRDQGDVATLVRLLREQSVRLHSCNEGEIDLSTANGRLQVGFHGLMAQWMRDHLIDNVRMGMRQAAESGRWLNRAPTGYDMVNGELVPNEMAPLVQRCFNLRAAGASYPEIVSQVGMGYSTVRQICQNRVYLGETKLRDEYFPVIHPALVSLELFNAAARGHIPGRRRSKHRLSGKARCGMCGRVAGIEYNERNDGFYRRKHRGEGCSQPSRSASGVLRATVIALRAIKDDKDLQEAIREDLMAHRRGVEASGPSVSSVIAGLKVKRDKLLGLYYADKITDDTFADEERRLTAQIATLEVEAAARRAEHEHRDELAERFEDAAQLLASFDFDEVWEEATLDERRTIVEDLVDSVFFYPNQVMVQVLGAPPILVTLEEARLRIGTKPGVSEEGRPRSPTGGSPVGGRDRRRLCRVLWAWRVRGHSCCSMSSDTPTLLEVLHPGFRDLVASGRRRPAAPVDQDQRIVGLREGSGDPRFGEIYEPNGLGLDEGVDGMLSDQQGAGGS